MLGEEEIGAHSGRRPDVVLGMGPRFLRERLGPRRRGGDGAEKVATVLLLLAYLRRRSRHM